MKTNTASTFQVPTHEGLPVQRASAFDQLVRSTSACLLFEDTFYEDGQSIADRITALVKQVPLQHSLTLAQDLRHKNGLRHAPLWILNACLEHPQRGEHSRQISAVIANVCGSRADLPGEMLAMYWKDRKRPLAKALRRGLADALLSLSSYAIQKYAARGPIRLRDVLFLVHPKPRNDVQANWFKLLADDELPPADTWETKLSAGADKRETFQQMIEDETIGALAILRNLRNMHNAGVPVNTIFGGLQKSVSKSKFGILPFQFIAAARAVPSIEHFIEPIMLEAVQKLDTMFDGVLKGHTILLVDKSGSMRDSLSSKSTLNRMDAAGAMAILLREVCENVSVFAYNDSLYEVPARRGFALRDALGHPAGGTNTGSATLAAMQHVQKKLGRAVDRVIVITDEQASYRGGSMPPLGGSTKGYVMNVASYENGIAWGRWTTISGFSESLVKFIAEIEQK